MGSSQQDDCYNDIRIQFNLRTSQNRRIVTDICFLSKLSCNEIDSSALLQQVKLIATTETLTNELFQTPFHSSNYGYYSPVTMRFV